MDRGTLRRVYALLSASVLSLVATAGWSQSLTWLGTLGGNGSWARGISADGAVVVGEARNASGYLRAFRWTEAGGMQDLGTLGGNSSIGRNLSADGSVVVGWATNAIHRDRAFRWTQAGGMQDLGTLPGTDRSGAYNVSADGAVVVGWSLNPAGGFVRAFRWTEAGGMQDLGTLGGTSSDARGISADGTVIVGWAHTPSNERRAFRWTEAGGMQDLGTLGGNASGAESVSTDGSVVVGWAYIASGLGRAFRWTEAGGMQDLGTLGGNASDARGVSADGSVVVGWAYNPAGQFRAFRWTQSRGMEDLNQTYASLVGGSVLEVAIAINPDWRYIVGYGYNAATGRTEGFLLDTYEPLLPQTFSLLRGFLRSGQLSDLFVSDNQYLRLIPGFVLNQLEPPIQVIVQTTAPVTQPLQVTLQWEVAANVPNVEERVELYNFTTGQWELLSQQVITQEDTRYQALVRTPGFVSSTGEIRMKLSYRALGLVLFYPWEVRLDEASFAIIR